jgi:hypothetical protein
MVTVTLILADDPDHRYRAHDGEQEYLGDTLVIGDALVEADAIHADVECDHVLPWKDTIILMD